MNTSVAPLTPQTMISMVNIAALKEDNFKKKKKKKKALSLLGEGFILMGTRRGRIILII